MERLVDFLDLGLHHQFHIRGDLAADAGDKTEEAADSAMRSRTVCQAISGWRARVRSPTVLEP